MVGSGAGPGDALEPQVSRYTHHLWFSEMKTPTRFILPGLAKLVCHAQFRTSGIILHTSRAGSFLNLPCLQFFQNWHLTSLVCRTAGQPILSVGLNPSRTNKSPFDFVSRYDRKYRFDSEGFKTASWRGDVLCLNLRVS